jgi:hypothetical protein
MLSFSLNTPPQAQLEALWALRLFGSGPSWLHAFPASAAASFGSGSPSWVHLPDIRSGLRFRIGLRLSFFRMSRFPDIFRSSRTSDVSARVGSSGSSVFRRFPDGSRLRCFRTSRYSDCSVFRYFPDKSDLRLFFVLVFSGIPAFSEVPTV